MQGEWPQHYLEYIMRTLAAYGRIGATKLLTFPSFGALAAGAFSSPQTIRIREPGTILGIYGDTLNATAPAFAGLQCRVQIGGTEYLWTDGQSPTYVSLLSLVGGAQNWFPLLRRAIPGVDWVADFVNNSALTDTPSLKLAFIADADVGRQMKQQ